MASAVVRTAGRLSPPTLVSTVPSKPGASPAVMATSVATPLERHLGTIANVTEMSVFVTNLASMIGLALAIDYSLFMVSRFREELRHHSVEIAIERMMGSVGRAVAVSGVAVAIGLSTARRAGVKLSPPRKGKVTERTRKSARYAYEAGQHERKPRRRHVASANAAGSRGATPSWSCEACSSAT